MSAMEKRLQLLLDKARYERVEAEAKSSGRSVAAVIREAIDLRFDDGVDRRRAALHLLLASTETVDGGLEPAWAETRALMDAELKEKFAR